MDGAQSLPCLVLASRHFTPAPPDYFSLPGLWPGTHRSPNFTHVSFFPSYLPFIMSCLSFTFQLKGPAVQCFKKYYFIGLRIFLLNLKTCFIFVSSNNP